MIFKNFRSKKKLMKEIEELKLQNAIACSNISSLENIIHARLDQKPVALKEKKIERISVLYNFLDKHNEEPLYVVKDRLAKKLIKEMQRMNCIEYDVAEEGYNTGKIAMSATIYIARKL